MPLIDFTTPFTGGPSFYTGVGSTNLVPSLFPVALNGRPYLLDLESNQFAHQFEPRVRDSSDNSTAPGESAINPQGFWRRGQKSWHLGAGQYYADDADAQEFRFYKSKGVNVWTKGQLILLNDTKVALSSANTNLKIAVTSTRVYVLDGANLKYTTDPFASSPTWTTATGLPAATPVDITSDGTNVYVTYPGTTNSFGLWKYTPAGVASNVAYGHQYGNVDFVKGFFITTGNAAEGNGNDLYFSPTGNVGADDYEHPVPTFEWIGSAGGQNAIYIAGYNGNYGAVYKLTIKADGTLDTPVLALELPTNEYPTDIHGYLGFIILGTNKGVRFCTADSNNNLVAGLLIPTTGSVKGITTEGRYAWFGWTNYDGTSGGLGRLDLGVFTSPNTPAYATDLMYSSTAAVLASDTFNSKRVFTISGVGVVVEDTANLVTSGTLETGTYTWDIPDRKFVPRFDIRSTGLNGTVELFTSYDRGDYVTASTWSVTNATQYTYPTSQDTLIEAAYKLQLNRASASSGPLITRWMARAWASPTRSKIITLPILLHQHMNVQGQDFYMDVETERELLELLVANPAIVSYQERETLYSVIVEDVEFRPVDSSKPNFLWEGTAVLTMRTVAE